MKVSLIKFGVKGKTSFTLFKVQERGFFTVFHLSWVDEWVACFFPGLHAAGEAFHILVAHRYDLDCLTGRRLLIVSASVENDLLIPCQRRESGFECVQGDRSFQLHSFELCFILICADEQHFSGFQSVINFFRRDALRFRHDLPPSPPIRFSPLFYISSD